MMAASHGHTDTVVELVKKGADIHIQNEVCCTICTYDTHVYVQHAQPHTRIQEF